MSGNRVQGACLLFSVVLLLGFSSRAWAQDPDLTLYVSDESAPLGGSFSATVTFDNTGPSLVDGWSYGVCIGDPAIVIATSIANSALVTTINGGVAPGFASLSQDPALGWTQGIVIDFFGMNKLAPGVGFALSTLTGSCESVGVSALEVCSTLGVPPVAAVIVIAGGSVTPQTAAGSVTVLEGPPPFSFHAATNGPIVVGYDPDMPAASTPIQVEFGIQRDVSNTTQLLTQGFSKDNACDGVFLTPASIQTMGSLAALNGGSGPGFLSANTSPTGGTGWTCGCVYSFMGGVFIQFSTTAPDPVVRVTYDADASSLAGDLVGASTALAWVENLGSPPVANVVVVGGASLEVALNDGLVTFQPVIDVEHVRGDCNNDGTVNIADAIAAIQVVVGNLPATITPCHNACDANDDGLFDTSDGVFIINYQFIDGPLPAAPFPNCGTEPGADCESFSSCP